jgi:hypothetical protein
VSDPTQPGVLPLRPLTAAELLDAAVALLRTRLGWLLGAGLAVALAEQLVLFPLRRAADVDLRYLPGTGLVAPYLVMISVGFATEAAGIALLGGIASSAAPRALLGPAAPTTRRNRVLPVVLISIVVAALCGGAWYPKVFPDQTGVFVILGILLWPIAYGLTGLAVPATVIDGVGPVRALFRSVRLASRRSMRGLGVRLLGYFSWLLVRAALGLGGLALLTQVINSPSTTVDELLLGAAWLVVNTLAYPMLACLDAVTHLEIRMRAEGLDIALRRLLVRGVSTEATLAAP